MFTYKYGISGYIDSNFNNDPDYGRHGKFLDYYFNGNKFTFYDPEEIVFYDFNGFSDIHWGYGIEVGMGGYKVNEDQGSISVMIRTYDDSCIGNFNNPF